MNNISWAHIRELEDILGSTMRTNLQAGKLRRALSKVNNAISVEQLLTSQLSVRTIGLRKQCPINYSTCEVHSAVNLLFTATATADVSVTSQPLALSRENYGLSLSSLRSFFLQLVRNLYCKNKHLRLPR